MSKIKDIVLFLFLSVIALATACTPSPGQLQQTMEDHPEIIVGALEKHPEVIFPAIQKAAQKAQQVMHEQEEKDETNRIADEIKNPLKPALPDDRAYQGDKDAPILIVEYSDFQCPFCRKGYETMQEVEKQYAGKIRFLYKNMPLPFHPFAMPAAKRYEAIVLQSHEKAYKYYDTVFSNQDKLTSQGEKYLDEVAKKIGVNVAQMKKDMEGDVVNKHIQEDIEEAKKFGITGTPGFIVNGVAIKGAYPFDTFKDIIDKTTSAKKGNG